MKLEQIKKLNLIQLTISTWISVIETLIQSYNKYSYQNNHLNEIHIE